MVLLDGRPERLLIERGDALSVQTAGARAVARVRRVERGLGSAFLDLGAGADAILALTGPAAHVSEGQALEVEVAAPPRRGKGATVRLIGPAEGAPRLLAPAPGLVDRLRAFAPGLPVVEGPEAREAADTAEEEALAVEHPLGGGASLAVETTRALTAVDVDVGAAGGSDRARGQARLNVRAVAEAARLLRLKGLGGIVVFDLAGRGQDGEAVLAAARAAFAVDQPGVVFGPVSRLGLFQLALPWRETPVAERLLAADGRPSAETTARRLAREIQREAATCTRVIARCAPETASAAEGLKPALVETLGPRFDIVADPALARERFEVRPHG